MVTKSNNPLTEDEIAKYNAAIADFVKKNSNYVNYSELDDGNTYITLQYGMVRNSALREIANRCRTSLTDNVFKIGTLNCTIQFATSGILRFVGKTAEIHAELPNLDKETYGELIKKTSSEINLPASLTTDVGSLASTIATFATLSDSKLAEMGITTSTIGNKKHISFDVSKIEKYVTKNPSNEQAVALNGAISSVIGAYKEFPKATLTKISESLSSAGLELERLNGNVIMLSLGIAKPDNGNGSDDPSGTDEEFEYEKVPGQFKYMIVHFGSYTKRQLTADDVEVKFSDINYDDSGVKTWYLMDKTDHTVYMYDIVEADVDETELRNTMINAFINDYQMCKLNSSDKVLMMVNNPIQVAPGGGTSDGRRVMAEIVESIESNAEQPDFLNLLNEKDKVYAASYSTPRTYYVEEHLGIGSSDGLIQSLSRNIYHDGGGNGSHIPSNLTYSVLNYDGRYAVESNVLNAANDYWSTIDYLANYLGDGEHNLFSHLTLSTSVIEAAIASGRAIDVFIVPDEVWDN